MYKTCMISNSCQLKMIKIIRISYDTFFLKKNNYNNMKIFICLIIFCSVYVSCVSQRNRNFGKESTWTLLERESFLIDLRTNDGAQYVESCNSFIFWNGFKSEIIFFDADNKIHNRKISIDIPNSMDIRSVYYISQDSMLLYSHKTFDLYLVNGDGRIRNKYNLRPLSKTMPIVCSLTQSGKILLHKDKLYVPGFSVGEKKDIKNKPSGICLDMNTKEYNYFMDIPEKYFKYYWGGLYSWLVYATSNNKSQVVYSYPACHEVYVYDVNTQKSKSFPGGSSLIEEIEPLSEKRMTLVPEIKDEATKYFFNNNSYELIKYDKYRDCYYRMAFFPNEESENYAMNRSIIILSNTFEFLGEKKLRTDVTYTSALMVTPKGIFVPFHSGKQKGLTHFIIEKIEK